MAQRAQLLDTIADSILLQPAEGILSVGIDGVDGAGKSMFGDELTRVLQERGRRIIRASVDSFHNPRTIRYRRGRDSPEGFFLDSFDYPNLKQALLDPLRCGRPYRTKVHDLESDESILQTPQLGLPD